MKFEVKLDVAQEVESEITDYINETLPQISIVYIDRSHPRSVELTLHCAKRSVLDNILWYYVEEDVEQYIKLKATVIKL